MPYRQPADVPKPAARPIERLFVSRYGVYPAILILLASVALVAFVSWTSYGRTRLVCTRSSAGATPRCAAKETGFAADSIDPFDLHTTSLRVVERSSDDGTYYAIGTPTRDLHRGVDKAFAESTVARAQRFLASPNELSFEAEHAKTATSTAFAIGGVFFVVIIVLILKRTDVEVDRDGGVVRVGKRSVHRLIEIASASVEDIDESAFKKVVAVMKDGTTIALAEGRESECEALARALRNAIAELKPNVRRDDGTEAERAIEDGEAKWARAEATLRERLVRFVALDPRGVTRDTEREVVEARGKWRDVEVHASMDAADPNGITLGRDVSTELELLEVHLDEDAAPEEGSERVFFADGVFTDDEEEAAVLRAMPADLRERLVGAMRSARIRTVGIYSDETIVEGAEGADLHVMLDLVVDVADWASRTTTPG